MQNNVFGAEGDTEGLDWLVKLYNLINALSEH